MTEGEMGPITYEKFSAAMRHLCDAGKSDREAMVEFLKSPLYVDVPPFEAPVYLSEAAQNPAQSRRPRRRRSAQPEVVRRSIRSCSPRRGRPC